MSFPYTVAAFDLDGTLAESKQPMSISMTEKLFQLAVRGIQIVIISGGSFIQFQKQVLPPWLVVQQSHKADGEKASNNLVLLPVCGTQQYFYDTNAHTWLLMYSEEFDTSIRSKAKQAIESLISADVYDIPKNPVGSYIDDRGTQITFSALGQDAPFLAKQSWDPDQKKKMTIRDVLAAQLPELEIRVGGSTSIDILPKGFDKAIGLQKLCEYMHVSKEKVIFVGDAIFPGGNDDPVAHSGIHSIDVDRVAETEALVTSWLGELLRT